MTDTDTPIARALRAARAAERMTQAQVADACGVSRALVCRYESGIIGHRGEPALALIAAAVGLPRDEFEALVRAEYSPRVADALLADYDHQAAGGAA